MLAAVGLVIARIVYRGRGDHFAVISGFPGKDLELLPIMVTDQVILFPLAA